jgi:hypothetical protein
MLPREVVEYWKQTRAMDNLDEIHGRLDGS